jgi:hypothetical protein
LPAPNRLDSKRFFQFTNDMKLSEREELPLNLRARLRCREADGTCGIHKPYSN